MSRGRPNLTAAQELKKEKERTVHAMKYLSAPSYSAAGLGVSERCMESLCQDGLAVQVPGSGPFPTYTITDAGMRA